MFWRFGGYTSISTIDTILDKPDFSLEELLDEGDLLQELKQHNAKLIEYLRQDHVLERLLSYVVAPKLAPVGTTPADRDAASSSEEDSKEKEKEKEKTRPRLLPFSRPRAKSTAAESEEEEQEKKRNRYAYVSAEVLASETWSIYEALLENSYLVRDFWKFLQRETPLDPLQASYFTKVNEALFEKKTAAMTLLFMSVPDSVNDLLRHIDCPMIMDLLLKIISMDRQEGGEGMVEWLYTQNMMPALISFLSPEQTWPVQTAAGEFIKAVITISANASQNEQACIGPNELTRQLVSKPCVEQLVRYMLAGGNALTVGVGIIIEVIRKNNSDYDPDVCAEVGANPSSRDPIYLGTLLRLFAQNVPNFMGLMANAPAQKMRLVSTFGEKIEPLGFDRFKTCELMAELLHCSNMGLLNEVGAEDVVTTRDAERQRLRVEGKLSSHRSRGGALLAAEDIALRGLGTPEEGRRLEVTNISDDDGFEEVEHSREMNEDTSHEFVKAEEEIPAIPASTFLDKDDEDFVDEPLSSPKALAQDDKADPQFELPELVVAPLSPKKKSKEYEASEGGKADVKAKETKEPELDKAVDATGEEANPKEPQYAPESGLERLMEEKLEIEDKGYDDAKTEADRKSEERTEASSAAAGETADVRDDKVAATRPLEYTDTPNSSNQAQQAGAAHELSPHPEDIPPPLFSPKRPSEGQLGYPDDENDSEDTGTEIDEDSAPESTFVKGGQAQDAPRREPAEPIDPVVGDFLKTQFVDHKVVPTILSFFFKYPWNNFLHNVVYDIIQQVFNGPMDRGYNPTLAISLFDAADITASIVKGQSSSDDHQAKMKTRLGYMGHLTLIAEEVVKFTERHPPEMLSDAVMDKVMSAEWINYVEGRLAETRERDNAILGGVRPELAMNHRMGMAGNALAAVGLTNTNSGSGTSNALADAGLNGNIELNDGNSNGVGPFAISSGTLISGFGSSSDEEDEDGEDNEEDVNNEFRAYTDPSSSLLAPPTVPPPPPPAAPLNVPPSRARLQLTAQLAKRKKEEAAAAAAAAAAASDAGGEKPGADDGDEPKNPFADEEEVDVDSDDEDANDSVWSRTGRGSWWRDVVQKQQPGKDGAHDSDEDAEEDDDEEFGDFAMPEVDTVTRVIPSDSKVIKPLAVYPPQQTSSPGQKSGFGGIWPFSSQNFGGPLSESPKEGGDKAGSSPPETATEGQHAGILGLEGRRNENMLSKAPQVYEEDGRLVEGVVAAKRRTSIEDPDDEEVVV